MSNEDLKSDYKIVFGSEHGQRVLSHIMEECSISDVTLPYDGGQVVTDTNAMLFNEGRRSVALMVLQMLERSFSKLTEE